MLAAYVCVFIFKSLFKYNLQKPNKVYIKAKLIVKYQLNKL